MQDVKHIEELRGTTRPFGGGEPIFQDSESRNMPKKNTRLQTKCDKGDTVDGRNPAPIHMVILPLFTRFIQVRWLAGFLNHQQQ